MSLVVATDYLHEKKGLACCITFLLKADIGSFSELYFI